MFWILFWIDFNEFIKTGKIHVALVHVEEISCNPKFKIESIIKASLDEVKEALNNPKIPKPFRTCMPCHRILLERIFRLEQFSSKISNIYIDPRKYPKFTKTIEDVFWNIAYMQIIRYYVSSIRKYVHPDYTFATFLHYLFYKRGFNYNKSAVEEIKKRRRFKEKMLKIKDCFET